MLPQLTPSTGAKPSYLYLQNQTARIARSIGLLREIRVAARTAGDLGDYETAVAHIVTLVAADALGSDIDRVTDALQGEGL